MQQTQGHPDPHPDDLAGELDLLPTEQVQPGLADLDLRPLPEIVGRLLAAEAEVTSALAAARDALSVAAETVADRLARGGRLVYVGAGTPGRLAALDAIEWEPTFGVDRETVVAVVAGGEDAVETAQEAAEDDTDAARKALADLNLSGADAVVGITASGRTPYVIEALAVAAEAGAATIAITNNAGSPAASAADHAVELLTGPEVLAGSTRLKAGTAQKGALDVLSTAAMIRCGRTYGPWMTGVQATNDKLRRRAARIVREITGADSATAARALDAASGDTETALVMLLLDVDEATARGRLAAAGGSRRGAGGVRAALAGG